MKEKSKQNISIWVTLLDIHANIKIKIQRPTQLFSLWSLLINNNENKTKQKRSVLQFICYISLLAFFVSFYYYLNKKEEW